MHLVAPPAEAFGETMYRPDRPSIAQGRIVSRYDMQDSHCRLTAAIIPGVKTDFDSLQKLLRTRSEILLRRRLSRRLTHRLELFAIRDRCRGHCGHKRLITSCPYD